LAWTRESERRKRQLDTQQQQNKPAVSQISNFTIISSNVTVWVKKAAGETREKAGERQEAEDNKDKEKPPIVGCWYSKNSFFTKRSTQLDLPTAASPSHNRRRRGENRAERQSNRTHWPRRTSL
jgi:hypothetical protein